MRVSELTAGVIALARAGVDYTSRHGAVCPGCGKRTRVYCTRPWEGSIRVRYHRCGNHTCLIGHLGLSIKSIEVDNAG